MSPSCILVFLTIGVGLLFSFRSRLHFVVQNETKCFGRNELCCWDRETCSVCMVSKGIGLADFFSFLMIK